MAEADISNLVLLSDTATNGDMDLDKNGVVEIPNGGLAVNGSNIITLKDTNLTELNFFADADQVDIADINLDGNADQLMDTDNDGIADAVDINNRWHC